MNLSKSTPNSNSGNAIGGNAKPDGAADYASSGLVSLSSWYFLALWVGLIALHSVIAVSSDGIQDALGNILNIIGCTIFAVSSYRLFAFAQKHPGFYKQLTDRDNAARMVALALIVLGLFATLALG